VDEPEDDRRNVETMKSFVIRDQRAELRKSRRP
jgi:hypothetical protein